MSKAYRINVSNVTDKVTREALIKLREEIVIAQKSLSSITSTYNDLLNQVTRLTRKSSESANESDLVELSNKVNTLQTELNNTNTSLSTLRTRVGTVENLISQLERDIISLQQSVSLIDFGKLEQLENIDLDAIASISVVLEGINESIATLSSTIEENHSDLQTKIDTINLSITELSDRVTALEDLNP